MSDTANAENREGSPQPLADALERIGDRWMLLVIGALLEGPRRFGELQQSVPGVATNVLAGRLRGLSDRDL